MYVVIKVMCYFGDVIYICMFGEVFMNNKDNCLILIKLYFFLWQGGIIFFIKVLVIDEVKYNVRVNV